QSRSCRRPRRRYIARCSWDHSALLWAAPRTLLKTPMPGTRCAGHAREVFCGISVLLGGGLLLPLSHELLVGFAGEAVARRGLARAPALLRTTAALAAASASRRGCRGRPWSRFPWCTRP